jgi:hypothetical protein
VADFDIPRTNRDKYIIPIILMRNGAEHIVSFNIDYNRKELIYFDTYGMKANPMISLTEIRIFTKKLKRLLIEKNIIGNDFKLILFHYPIQLKLLNDNICIILQVFFTTLFIILNNKKDILETMKSFTSDANIDKFKKLIAYVYLSTIL